MITWNSGSKADGDRNIAGGFSLAKTMRESSMFRERSYLKRIGKAE